MNKPYRTVSKSAADEVVINKSRFIGYAAPCETEDATLAFLNDIRLKHRDASHCCYAYVIGQNAGIMRYNDDGEPSGTAGLPIMEVLKAQQVVNLCVVVVRYFGGTLLGTSGLITAYKEAANDAFEQAEIIEKTIDVRINIHFEYPLMNEAMRIVKETDAQILQQGYETDCSMTLNIRLQEADILRGKLEKVEGISIEE